MAAKRKWSDLTKASRDRAARQASREYGLTRKQVRDRYNRGTLSPFSRDPIKRIPTEFRREAIRTPEGKVTVDWYALALGKMSAVFGSDSPYGERIKWNDRAVAQNLAHASPEVLRAITMSTEDELLTVAFVQKPDEQVDLPHGLTIDDIGYYITSKKSGQREWVNIFWYH